MKKWIKIAVLALVAVIGSILIGGTLWVWFAGLFVVKFIARLLFTLALAVVLYVLFYALIIGGILWILIS
ncbi:hypothetical protein BN938_0632 [Mucinivorans hirudinis]|uniref:Trasnmembrane protein found in conjugate transposon n=1 Tax=Mucinivorans hirudinis TaxID=1433126 RepID=A0A060R6S6_9BACT|nr:hypothetical protein BN938_0632 [Mucinivorans hirudinis]